MSSTRFSFEVWLVQLIGCSLGSGERTHRLTRIEMAAQKMKMPSDIENGWKRNGLRIYFWSTKHHNKANQQTSWGHMLGDGSQMIGKIKTFDLNKAPLRLLQKKRWRFVFALVLSVGFSPGKLGFMDLLFCWWRSPVEGTVVEIHESPGILEIPGGWPWDFWTINSPEVWLSNGSGGVWPPWFLKKPPSVPHWAASMSIFNLHVCNNKNSVKQLLCEKKAHLRKFAFWVLK